MHKKIIYASNGETRALYDEDGFLIYDQQHGDDLTFMLRALFNDLGVEMESRRLPERIDEIPKFLDKRRI
jgi:hypothetical protein